MVDFAAVLRKRELLVRVRKSGMKIVLATSSDQEGLVIYGQSVGMEELVDEASSNVEARASTPEADIFAAALKKVVMQPQQPVALGGTPWEAEAAGKLGIPVIGR